MPELPPAAVAKSWLWIMMALLCAAWDASPTCAETPERTIQPAAFATRKRVAAEWEPVVGVLIAWPLKLPMPLVVALAKEVDLYLMVSDDRHAERAGKFFAECGIDPDRVHFVVTQQGVSYYLTRDWGPLAVFDEQGRYQLVDSRYRGYQLGTTRTNRVIRLPGPDHRRADRAPVAVARALGSGGIELPIALTGGNIVFDGHGTAFASEVMLDENRAAGISGEVFLGILQHELGVRQFHVIPNFERFGIQHLDCVLKLLDEERILVKRAPPDHPSFKHIENVLAHLSRLTNVYGRPYQLLRIDTPRYAHNELANYTNSVIVNRSVFVPLFGIPADTVALSTYRSALPGYEVHGFEYRGWKFDDALHCRVRGIWDPHMLYLAHRRMDAVVGCAGKFSLAVHVRDYSGAGLIEDQLQLVWRIEGEPHWRRVRLQPTDRRDDFQGSISGIQPGQSVEYFFAAASRSGRQETLPRTAPAGVYSFKALPRLAR